MFDILLCQISVKCILQNVSWKCIMQREAFSERCSDNECSLKKNGKSSKNIYELHG